LPLLFTGCVSGQGAGRTATIRAQKGITSLAFAPGGKLLASASEDGTVKVWDIATGKARQELKGKGWGHGGVRFSREGKLIALTEGYFAITGTGPQGALTVWDVESGKQLRPAMVFSGVWAQAFSADGKLMAARVEIGLAHSVMVWQTTTGKTVTSLKEGEREGPLLIPGLLSFAHEGNLLAYSYASRFGHPRATVAFWDPERGRSKQTVEVGPEITAMAWKQGGSLLACGCADGAIKVVDARKRAIQQTLKGHSRLVWSIAFAESHNLVSADKRGTIKVWDLRAGKEMSSRTAGTGKVRCAAISDDGKLAALASASGEVTVLATLKEREGEEE
jgi:WD40 repeat protein